MKNILIIDDDQMLQAMLNDILKGQEWEVHSALDCAEASRILAHNTFSIILLDIYLPDQDGLEFLASSKNLMNSSLVIVTTVTPSLERALEAIKLGVYDFIPKPLKKDELLRYLDKAFDYWKSKQENAFLLTALRKKIADLEETNLQLNIERTRIYALLKDMNEGVLLMNEKGKINLINRKAIEIFDIATGKENKFSAHSTHFHELMKKMNEVRGKGKGSSYQFKTGEKRTNFYNVHLVPLIHNNCTEALAVVNDVTELIRTYEMRSSFTSKISHELRTPLSNIKSSLKIIKKKYSNDYEKLKEYFSIIEKELDQLYSEISALLDFGAYADENVDLILEENDLNKVINQEINDLLPKFRKKNIDLRIKLPTLLQSFVFDSEKIAKVIRNLLENACRFTPVEGSVEIGSEMYDEYVTFKNKYFLDIDSDLKSQFVVIYTKDSGIGIEAAEKEKIFEPFYQAESIFEHKEGMGLGLFICKSIIKAHGGFIWAKSNGDKGSTFYFALPLIGAKDDKLKNIYFKTSK